VAVALAVSHASLPAISAKLKLGQGAGQIELNLAGSRGSSRSPRG
jgi:hypothetical protein